MTMTRREEIRQLREEVAELRGQVLALSLQTAQTRTVQISYPPAEVSDKNERALGHVV
jgi:hypothetical protein